MQKKKFIITLLFAILSIFMITACNDSSNESSNSGNNGGGGTVQPEPEPEPEPDKPTVKEFYSFAISSFYSNISQYAILSDGSLYAWGCNDHGQLGLGDNNYYYPSNAKKVDIPGNVKQLVSVITETYDYDTYTRYIMPSFYAITEDGELYAWGYNEDGRLGINNKDNQTKPVKVAGITGRINELIALEDNSNTITLSFYAITEDGSLYAWGDNSNGHLGVGDEINRNTPTKVNLPGKIKELITPEDDSFFALMNDGSFYAWGNNSRDQLGVESSNSSVNTPNKVNLSGTIKEIITGESSFYTKLEDGSFYEFKEYSKPRKINLPGNIRELITSYAILEDGSLYELEISSEPRKINLPSKIKELIIDGSAVYAILEDGSLYAWGNNYNGQLGVGSENEYVNTPTKVNLPGKIKELIINSSSTYAILEDGSLYAWGYSLSGELGVGSENEYVNTPTKVNLPANIKELIINYISAYAILEDGSLYAWGFNFSGQLGIGSENEYVNTPTKVNLPGTIKELITNVNSVYAILEDNSLYAWGYNENGQLGVGDYKNRNTPEKVIKIEGTIKKVIFSNNYQELINTNIIMDDGSLYGIGYDYASYPIKVKFDNQ